MNDALRSLKRLGVIQSVLRVRARRHLDELEPGAVTVVIASWNSDQFLPVALEGVRRFADRPTRIIVVDNHSSNDPRKVVESFDGTLVRLPVNLRHSVAMDIGFLLTRTEYVMSLDADAFPYAAAWMPTFLRPLEQGYQQVGCQLWRPYAHPCCMAMRTRTFVLGKHSFVPRTTVAHGHPEFTDVGEDISRKLTAGAVALVTKTGNIVGDDWFVGASFGDVLYHNLFSSRHLHLENPDTDGLDPSDDFAMTRPYALNIWEEALRRFGPANW